MAGGNQPALQLLFATHLVDNGKLLKAQARLGHCDVSTTLRHYSHATLFDDLDIADELDAVLKLATLSVPERQYRLQEGALGAARPRLAYLQSVRP